MSVIPARMAQFLVHSLKNLITFTISTTTTRPHANQSRHVPPCPAMSRKSGGFVNDIISRFFAPGRAVEGGFALAHVDARDAHALRARIGPGDVHVCADQR